jgi:hypothetical protein
LDALGVLDDVGPTIAALLSVQRVSDRAQASVEGILHSTRFNAAEV